MSSISNNGGSPLSGNSGPTSVGGSVSGVMGSTSSKGHSVVTSSMVHWEKPLSELPDTMTVDYRTFMNSDGSSSSASKNAVRVSDGRRGVFFVDGEEMFVPTSLVLIQNLAVDGASSASQQQQSPQSSSDSESSKSTAVAAPSSAIVNDNGSSKGENDQSINASAVVEDFFVVL